MSDCVYGVIDIWEMLKIDEICRHKASYLTPLPPVPI